MEAPVDGLKKDMDSGGGKTRRVGFSKQLLDPSIVDERATSDSVYLPKITKHQASRILKVAERSLSAGGFEGCR
jgi:hypothetical protein